MDEVTAPTIEQELALETQEAIDALAYLAAVRSGEIARLEAIEAADARVDSGL